MTNDEAKALADLRGTLVRGLSGMVDVREAEIASLRASNAALVRVNEVYWAEIQAWREQCGSEDDRGWRCHPVVPGTLTDEGLERVSCVAMPECAATDHAREGTK